MPSSTLTRASLVDALVSEIGVSRQEAHGLVEMFLEEISAALAAGENVKLSSFGTFSVREKGERIGRNPKTGQEVPITPRRVIVFKASNILKNRINRGLLHPKAAE